MTLGENVRRLRATAKMSQAVLAERSGIAQSAISELESGKRHNTSQLPALAQALNVSVAELDPRFEAVPASGEDGPLHYRPPPVIVSRERTIPLFASAEGSNGNGSLIISTEPMDWVPRPFTLENVKDAYAILIEGESMVPAFEPGDMAWVNPMQAARRDHDVIVYGGDERYGEARAMIKRMVSYTDAEWTVRQWNPAETFKLERRLWGVCHRVVGKLSRR